MSNKFYALPDLPYSYGELAPYISEEQLRTHYEKHHAAYVAGANNILERLDKASGGEEVDLKAESKAFGFNVGGFVLHCLFWENMAPKEKGGGGEPSGAIAEEIKKSFGDFSVLRAEILKLAMSVEGSGWAALVYCEMTGRLIPMQVEKHNVNIYPTLHIIMVLDAFEHAYYIDYKNEKKKFFEGFWDVVNWQEINKRLEKIK